MQACVRKEHMHASGASRRFHACCVARAGARGLEALQGGRTGPGLRSDVWLLP